jgi:hypothetical protein
MDAVARTAAAAAKKGVLGLRRRRGVVGGGGLGTVGADAGRGGVEEVVEAPADDVDVQILVPDNHGRGFDRSTDEEQAKRGGKPNRIVRISVETGGIEKKNRGI